MDEAESLRAENQILSDKVIKLQIVNQCFCDKVQQLQSDKLDLEVWKKQNNAKVYAFLQQEATASATKLGALEATIYLLEYELKNSKKRIQSLEKQTKPQPMRAARTGSACNIATQTSHLTLLHDKETQTDKIITGWWGFGENGRWSDDE